MSAACRLVGQSGDSGLSLAYVQNRYIVYVDPLTVRVDITALQLYDYLQTLPKDAEREVSLPTVRTQIRQIPGENRCPALARTGAAPGGSASRAAARGRAVTAGTATVVRPYRLKKGLECSLRRTLPTRHFL